MVPDGADLKKTVFNTQSVGLENANHCILFLQFLYWSKIVPLPFKSLELA